MSKLNEIKAFIQKSAKVMAELAQAAQSSELYYSAVSDAIIEQQQDLQRHARRLHVISVEEPFSKEAEFKVLIRFEEFSSFINLDECKQKVSITEEATHYFYSIVVDNLLLKTLKTVPNEEHKKTQAI